MQEVIEELRQVVRMERQLERAKTRSSNQSGAIERMAKDAGFNEGVAALATIPLQEVQDVINKHQNFLQRRIKKLAKQLPVYQHWAKDVRGLSGGLSLGRIIGEAGDLNNYPNPAKLWKRMGLAVIDGGAQRRVKNETEAEKHGFSPYRRSLMFVISSSLLKNGDGYKELFQERRDTEIQKAQNEGREIVTPDKNTAERWQERGDPVRKIKQNEFDTDKHRSCGHITLRSQRYVSKRLLRDLWQAWRECEQSTGSE